MASRQEDGKRILDLFKAAYEACEKVHEAVVEMNKGAMQKGFERKRACTSALLGELKQMNAGFNSFHHSIGHLFFNQCWDNTEVGEEFVNPIQALLDKLGIKMEAEVINLDEPLPDHLEPEVKDALNNFKHSQQMSRKSHLH